MDLLSRAWKLEELTIPNSLVRSATVEGLACIFNLKEQQND